jgi:leucine dehydrogenase
VEAAVDDACRLARAMTIKCALGGLDAGGGKCVVIDHPGLDRPAAFAALGDRFEELGGLFRTAGDLGTTAADLAAMAARCRYVHTDESGLATSVARGLLRCVEACAEVRGTPVDRLSVAVQGAGAIGAAVCRVLAGAGARVVVADIDGAQAARIAGEVGGSVGEPGSILASDVDIVAPCAVGGVIDRAAASALRAWAVCGAANNILSDDGAEDELVRRQILFVPDVIASAGAVVDGIGASVMGLVDRAPLIDRLGATARELLLEHRRSGRPFTEIAEMRARARLESR